MPRAKFFVFCARASTSAVRLARSLGGKRIKRVASKYKQKKGDVVINYGCSEVPYHILPTYQQPHAVFMACSKMATYRMLGLHELPIPPYTQDKELAQSWANEGTVLGRDMDRGSKGLGIVVYKKGEMVGDNLFYTKYVRKEREFRFHVFKGTVIHTSEKMRIGKDNRGPEFNARIRSHNCGWVLAFFHLYENPPPVGGELLAIKACACLGLDFGACDVGWSEEGGYVIYEVNTAPGIEGTTLKAYVRALTEDKQQLGNQNA